MFHSFCAGSVCFLRGNTPLLKRRENTQTAGAIEKLTRDVNEIKLNWHAHFAVEQSLREDFSYDNIPRHYMLGGFSILKLFDG